MKQSPQIKNTKNHRNPLLAVKGHLLQLLFVFLAFIAMAVTGHLFIGRILHDRLLSGAEELLFSASANIKAGFSEAEITLLNSYHIVKNIMRQDASKEEILDYLVTTTSWMRQRDSGLLDFHGVYGLIHGEYYDGVNMSPQLDFVPQTRPWYQTAIRSGTRVGYTTPYIDWHTNETIVSAVRNLDVDGEAIGMLAVDINIRWLRDFVGSLKLTPDGYGILLSQNLSIMAHPDENILGKQLHEIDHVYGDIARTLRNDQDVFEYMIEDKYIGSAIVFFRRIFNDWYVGIVTPSPQFYKDLNFAAQILIGLAIVLSLFLSLILLRLSLAKQQSEEENKTKSSFLAQMSHEIRTPLSAIIGFSEIELKRDALTPESKNNILQIFQSGSSLLRIINDILDISKIEAGGFDIISAEYDVASFVDDTINLNKVRIGSKPIKLILEIDSDFPAKLKGDEIRVRQLLNNILSNAIKYTIEGSVKLEIKNEKLSSQETQIYFTVTDTGIGIKPEDLGKLFSEYTQLDVQSNRKIEGTGLGLAITKKLVEKMGGEITAQSEYGKGTVFSLHIIQELVDSETIGAETAERLKRFRYQSLKKQTNVEISWMPYGKVLVVDDLLVNLMVVRGLLQPYGLKIDTVLSGQDAIDILQTGEIYDLIFMDHMMPGMDGIETVKIIRKWESKKENVPTPIIALTANAMAGNIDMFLSKGFNGFISKPIDSSKLNEALNQWIRDKQSDEVLQKAEQEKREKTGNNDENIQRIDHLISSALIEMFLKDAKDAIATLKMTCSNGDMKLFTTTVHGMKTILAVIGKNVASEEAAALERAALSRNVTFIADNAEKFIEHLEFLINTLSPAEIIQDDKEDVQDDKTYLYEQLQIAKDACINYDEATFYAAFSRLNEKQWTKETMGFINEIYRMMYLHSNFEGVAEKINIAIDSPQ